MRLSALALLLSLATPGCGQGVSPAMSPTPPVFLFTGMADASAGLNLGGDWFAVVSDEENILAFHRWSQPGKPLKTMDLSPHLGIDALGKNPEADLEGLARSGDLVFGITSHGRNKDGKFRPNRHRLFALLATDATGSNPPELAPFGRAYTKLADAIAEAPGLTSLGLGKHLQLEADKKGKVKDYVPLAPKDEGFNIEGLAATPEGRLLIGLRNPLSAGKAIIIPLANPREVCESGAAPVFTAPLLLDLGGRAVRSLEWLPKAQAYGICAGPSGADGEFAFYLWDGTAEGNVRKIDVPWPADNFKAEGLFADPSGKLYFLSDDGTYIVKGAEQKTLPRNEQTFRAFSFELPAK